MMNWQPLGAHIAVERLPVEKTGLIEIPAGMEGTRYEGIVRALGEGRLDDYGRIIEPQFEVDDHIIFAPYTGMTVNRDGKTYLLLTEEDILAKVQDAPK